MSPVVPHFPHPHEFQRSLFGKMGNRAGITQQCPTGTDEVENSNVTKTESGRECDLGRGWYRQGDVFASSPGTSGIMRKSTE